MTKNRGKSPRLYSGALLWCARKPGRELRESVESLLAWRRVAMEVSQGFLGTEFGQADHTEVQVRVREAERVAREAVWAGYRFVALGDAQAADGLKVIDLGAGHSSGSETLCGRIIAALKSEALLNESVGAGYIGRHWPPAFEDTGAWPLLSLRQSFLNRCVDAADRSRPTLRGKSLNSWRAANSAWLQETRAPVNMNGCGTKRR